MSVTVETGSTLPFDRFWRWLRQHANCIVRAGTLDVYLHDQDAFHWHLDEDAERNPVIQLVWAKLLVAEIVMDVRDVLYVEATPDQESANPGQFVFEVIGGSREEPYALYHFVMSHGFEEEGGHAPGLKH
jgi:hypothetical protein